MIRIEGTVLLDVVLRQRRCRACGLSSASAVIVTVGNATAARAAVKRPATSNDGRPTAAINRQKLADVLTGCANVPTVCGEAGGT